MFLFETRHTTAASAVLFIWLCSGAACWWGRRTEDTKSSMFILRWRRTTGPLSPPLLQKKWSQTFFSPPVRRNQTRWLHVGSLREVSQQPLSPARDPEHPGAKVWDPFTRRTVILHDLNEVSFPLNSCRCLSPAAVALRGSRSSLWTSSWTSSTASSETPDWTRFCTRRWRKSRSDSSWRDTRPTPASWREVTCLSSCLLLSPVSDNVWSLSEQWK